MKTCMLEATGVMYVEKLQSSGNIGLTRNTVTDRILELFVLCVIQLKSRGFVCYMFQILNTSVF